MRCTLRTRDDVAILDLSGDLVIGDGDEVLRAAVDDLLAQGWKKILLNMAHVSRMDSTGLGELVSSWKTARHLGTDLRLVRPGDRVRHTLHLSQILPLVQVYEGDEEAIAALAGPA